MADQRPEEDDQSILDGDRLLRRVRRNQLIWEDGVPRPSSVVFKTFRLSVNIASLMVAQGRALDSTLKEHPEEFLTAILAGDVRKFGHPVVKDVEPPNDPAHGLVLGKKRDGFANAMVRSQQWIVAPAAE